MLSIFCTIMLKSPAFAPELRRQHAERATAAYVGDRHEIAAKAGISGTGDRGFVGDKTLSLGGHLAGSTDVRRIKKQKQDMTAEQREESMKQILVHGISTDDQRIMKFQNADDALGQLFTSEKKRFAFQIRR